MCSLRQLGILSENIEDPVLRQMMREEEEGRAKEQRIKVGDDGAGSDDAYPDVVMLVVRDIVVEGDDDDQLLVFVMGCSYLIQLFACYTIR